MRLGFGTRVVFGRLDAALPDFDAALAGLSLRDLVAAEDPSSSALRLLLRVLPVPVATVLDEADALEADLEADLGAVVAVFFVPADFFGAAIAMIGGLLRLKQTV